MNSVHRFLSLLVTTLLLSPGTLHASDESLAIDRLDASEIETFPTGAVRVSKDNGELVIDLDCAEPRQVGVRLPVNRTIDDRKLSVTLGASHNLSYIGRQERLDDGTPIPRTFEHAYIEYQKGPVHFSLDDRLHADLVLEFFCISTGPGETASVRIRNIEFVPLGFTDDRDFAYLLALLLLAAFLAPGLLACTALVGGGDGIRLLALITPLSVVCFTALYPVLLIQQAWSGGEPGPALLAAYILLNLSLAAWLAYRGRIGTVFSNLHLIRFELIAVAIAVLCAAALLTEDLDLPLHTFNHLHLRELTYGIFYAHDSIFQYVNGIAILHDEPFQKYYAEGKLVYDVQDRAILTGVIYAVLRGIAAPIGSDIAYGSGYYTLYGAILNALMLLPLFAIHSWFTGGRPRPLLVLLVVGASGFVVSNVLITWYKLAGAGLVMSGIAVLLSGEPRLRQWLVAGVIWGLAANFHPGLALTYPVVTIWLLLRYFGLRGRKAGPVLLAFIVLTGSFLLVNLPWSAVKATHFEDTNALFRQHFLGFQGYDSNRGIAGSVEDFMEKHPLDAQLRKRSGRLLNSLRGEAWSQLADPGEYRDWEDLLYRWNALETSYLAFVLFPPLVLLALSLVAARLLPATRWKSPAVHHRADFLWLLATQALTVVLVILASYGPFEPDINWHVPMSCTVLVVYLLAHAAAATGRIGSALVVAYALFSCYRLFHQYF